MNYNNEYAIMLFDTDLDGKYLLTYFLQLLS